MKEEGVGGDHTFRLAGNLFGDESDGNEAIVHSGAEYFLGLKEGPRDIRWIDSVERSQQAEEDFYNGSGRGFGVFLDVRRITLFCRKANRIVNRTIETNFGI
jgi:hypothetical protein